MSNKNLGGLSVRYPKIYGVWHAMIQRCCNPYHKAFPRYGGRGISVADAWKDFPVFLDWALVSGYERGLSLDRLDNNAGYSPSNCRWANIFEQNRNKRTNAKVPFNGKEYCYGELAEMCGLDPTLIRNRIAVLGWSVEDAMTRKVREKA